MDTTTITSLIIIFIIVNGSLLLIGFLIKKYRLSELIIEFNINRDNKEKISALVGNNLMFAGLISFIGESIYFVVRNKISYNYYIIYFLLTILGLLLNIYIKWHEIRKRE